jgi:predicted small metal-binding protein
MKTIYSYACRDYPGMEACPGQFSAESEDELWKHMELHAVMAHQEDPTSWSAEDRAQLRTLIRVEKFEG